MLQALDFTVPYRGLQCDLSAVLTHCSGLTALSIRVPTGTAPVGPECSVFSLQQLQSLVSFPSLAPL